MTIFPGETASCEFTVPFGQSEITKGKLSFSQENKRMFDIDITSSNVTVESGQTIISVQLTQAQTLKLKNGVLCYAQLNLIINGDDRVVSTLMPIHVDTQTYKLPIV